MYLKIGFILFGILLFSLLCIYKLFVEKKNRTEKTAVYVSFMGAVLLLYVLSGILFAIFAPAFLAKVIIGIFAVSPFIIGKVVTYNKEGFYSFIQILCVFLSIFYSFVI